jgi:hypothetical protein
MALFNFEMPGVPRWRTVFLTLAVISVIHFLFVSDTLRSLYDSVPSIHGDETVTPEAPKAISIIESIISSPSTSAVPLVATPSPKASASSTSPASVSSAPETTVGAETETTFTTSASTTSKPSDTRSHPTPPPTPIPVAPLKDGDTEEYLALCVAVKNQPDDLAEFLTHHYHHHNIRRFYIMDDGSSPVLATLNWTQYIDPKAVTFRYYHPTMHGQFMQLAIYQECIQLYRHKHKWMGFVDVDEFLEVKGNETIHSILKELDEDENIGALSINWQIHNSAGLLTRPATARAAFNRCVEDPDPNHGPGSGSGNEHVKTFAKTKKFSSAGSPHNMNLKDKAHGVGEHNDTVNGPWRSPITRDRVALHHYLVKSKEEYQTKIDRNNAMGDGKDWSFWDKIEAQKDYECDSMTKLFP